MTLAVFRIVSCSNELYPHRYTLFLDGSPCGLPVYSDMSPCEKPSQSENPVVIKRPADLHPRYILSIMSLDEVCYNMHWRFS